MRNSYSILVGKDYGKKLLGRSRHRWKHNIKIHLKEIGCSNVDWPEPDHDIAQCRVFVNMAVNC
jgi:hypothetical protein